MVFSSIQFFIFFAFLLILFFIFKNNNIKKSILLAASIFFYAYWDIRFVPLLFVLAMVNYAAGSIMDNESTKNSKRKRVLIIGIVINLLVLAYFKYVNFFIDNINHIFSGSGFKVSTLNIILPLGISFFIFEFISYLVDIYNHRIYHVSSIINFLTFVFFFPRLASGPIIRPADFIPQLDSEIIIRRNNLVQGIQIFLMGIFKKLVIADNLALCVDTVFSTPQVFNSASTWIAVLAYSIQIYCDFSGYSDMAIGVSKILGFDLSINFNLPYISLNVTDFWKRWHISLSSWLQDYLYISLGGNRKGSIRKNLNLLLTMLLGGLWHGANWTFIVWGGLHGCALIIQKAFSKWYKSLGIHINSYITHTLSWICTFTFINISWVFFRAHSFHDAFIILKKMFIPSGGVNWIYIKLLFPILPIVILSYAVQYISKKSDYLIFDLSKPIPAFIFVFTIMAVFFLSASNTSPFIYFQF